MNASRPFHLLLLCAVSGCATNAATFSTIVAPPKTPLKPTPVEPPRTLEVEIGQAIAPAEQIVARFFLALRTGDRIALQRLLSSSATLTTSKGRAPALFELERLTNTGGTQGGTASASPRNIRILTLQERGDNSLIVTVDVDGPAAISGIWRLGLLGGGDKLIIQEVLVASKL